jgi:hypothetical protein
MAQAENPRRAYRCAGRVWCAWRVKRNLPPLPASGADVAAFLASERSRGLTPEAIKLRRAPTDFTGALRRSDSGDPGRASGKDLARVAPHTPTNQRPAAPKRSPCPCPTARPSCARCGLLRPGWSLPASVPARVQPDPATQEEGERPPRPPVGTLATIPWAVAAIVEAWATEAEFVAR